MSVKIDLKINGLKETKDNLSKLEQVLYDMSPIWKDFIKYYTEEFEEKVFSTKGRAQGEKWVPYSLAYAKLKGKTEADLRGNTDRLYSAATGKGSYFFKSIEKKKIEMGISDALKYNAIHQYGLSGKMPQRSYFFQKNNKLANEPIKKLENLITDRVKEANK